jgi:hypothetical protein
MGGGSGNGSGSSIDGIDGIVYRSILPSDYDVIKALHAELFPISYQESYYQSAVNSLGFMDRPMKTILAEVSETRYGYEII